MTLLERLAEAEANLAALRREAAQASCREVGHTWVFHGGMNAGCGPDCDCSVPVGVCSKCGDCDYGDTPDNAELIAACKDQQE